MDSSQIIGYEFTCFMKSIFSFVSLAIFLPALMTFESSAAQVKILPDGFNGAKQPQITADSRGNVFVAFGKENSLYVARSADGGKTFQTPKMVGTVEKLALGMRRGPRIVAGEKTVVITAIAHADGNLYSWNSENEGSTWSEPARINDVTKSAREGLHGMAGNESGLVFSVWLDLRNQKTQLWGARSTNEGKSWEPNVKIYQSPDKTICECCHPSVAVAADGKIVVMWRNWLEGNRDMYQARSEDGGKTFGPALKLGTTSWPLKGCPMDGGSLIVSSNQFVSVWRRENRLFASSSESPEIIVSDSGSQPVVARTKTGFDFLWQSNGNLYRKRELAGKTDLIARDAAYASAAWSSALQKSLIVWEGEGAIFCADEE